MAWNVLILGGGFGGLTAARRLERKLAPASATVTLVSDVNFMLYTPLLPGAAAGTLEPRHVVVPLREQLHHTQLHLGEVTGADPDRRVVSRRTASAAAHEELPYDQLIVALGSTSRTLPIPGLAEHALGFKTLSEAIALRNRVITRLEQAEIEDDADERAARCSRFVFVGAGYAGLEGLAELQDFAADVIERYPRARLVGVRFMLVEAKDRVMPEVPPSLAAFATAELRKRGIEVRTSTTIEAVTARTVTLSGGEVVPGADARLDRRRQAAPGRREARAPARRGRADRRRPLLRGAGPAGRLGDRRRRRRPRPGEEGQAVAADRPARAAPGQGRRRQRRGRADRRRRQAAAVPLPDARRVRRHGPQPGGGDDARDPLARLPGVVPRADVPPGADAGQRAARPADGGLDRRAAVRARLRRARAARPPAGAARAPTRSRARARRRGTRRRCRRSPRRPTAP